MNCAGTGHQAVQWGVPCPIACNGVRTSPFGIVTRTPASGTSPTLCWIVWDVLIFIGFEQSLPYPLKGHDLADSLFLVNQLEVIFIVASLAVTSYQPSSPTIPQEQPAAIRNRVAWQNNTVFAVVKEPIYGWTDNLHGPTGAQIGYFTGFIKSAIRNSSIKMDLVPVDLVVNSIIAAAYIVGISTASYYLFGLYALTLMCNGGVVPGPRIEPRPPAQKSDTLPLDHQSIVSGTPPTLSHKMMESLVRARACKTNISRRLFSVECEKPAMALCRKTHFTLPLIPTPLPLCQIPRGDVITTLAPVCRINV
uniref:Fatty acyl-CoA reductase n=1 Tax=Timema cristinae TaxID=61476 RepID=A0A7R9CMP8_TIMCR|nr:unnamed protein product [Timema cristinae]